MPRPLRYDLLEVPQHIVQRGNNRQRTFFGDSDCLFYLDCLWDASLLYGCSIHAYVLMPNHVHLLATPHLPKAIPRMMQAVGGRYVRYFNKRQRRSGTLWEGRYKASLVARENYLFNCYRYIELNPVRAKLVGVPEEFPWSSYRCNALAQKDDLVTPHPEFGGLGGSPQDRALHYSRMFASELTAAELAEIRSGLEQCRAFGPEEFRREMELRVRHGLAPVRVGRPRKVVH